MNWTDEDQVSIYYSMILTLLKHFLEKFPQPKYIWKPLKFTTEIMSNIAIILSRNEYQNIHMHAYSLSHVRLFATPWTVSCQAPLSMRFFSGKNTGVGWHFHLQGIFLSQRSNPSFLQLLHLQAGSLPLSHLEAIAMTCKPQISVA